MSNKQPAYMQTEWFNGLKKEIAAASVTAVAARLDISRTTLSVFVNGKGLYGTGGAKPDAIELRYRRVFEQLVCTHTGALVGVQHCRDIALRPAPTHNPLQMVQWQTCQQCTYKPRPVPMAAPVQPTNPESAAESRQRAVAFNGKATSGDEAFDEGWNCIGGPNDNPYPPEDSRSDYWDAGYKQRRESDKKQRQRLKQQDEVQQAGIIDKVTLPLPEVGAPQIANETHPAIAGNV